MSTGVVFALVVRKIFHPGVPLERKYFLCIFFTCPEILHFHCTWSLAFNGVIPDADCCCVVAVYRYWWLGMSKIFEGGFKNHLFLAIHKQCPKFCLGHWRHYTLQNWTQHMKSTVQFDRLSVPLYGAHEEMAACLDTIFWLTQIWCVQMDVQHHIWCSKSYHWVWVWCQVIEDLICFFLRYVLFLSFAHWQLNSTPLKRTYLPLLHSIGCCQQFSATVWFLYLWVSMNYVVRGGTVLRWYISWAMVSRGSAAPIPWCAHISTIVSWYILASKYPIFMCCNPIGARRHSISPRSNLSWVYMFPLSNNWLYGLHVLCPHIWLQNRRPQGRT